MPGMGRGCGFFYVTMSPTSPCQSRIIRSASQQDLKDAMWKIVIKIREENHMFFRQKAACQSLSMAQAAQELHRGAAIRLLDVRTQEEYRGGHIPGSVNVPLDRIADALRLIPDKEARVFVYCLSGGRSHMACGQLARLGYTDVTNIGGISQWPGRIEKGVSA